LSDRAQRALNQPIEYVTSDWSRLSEVDHSCEQQPEPRRLAADEEAALFRRMNYLKHQADMLRRKITRDNCSADTLDAIEHLLDEATRLRNYLVQVFSKLAASVARPYANSEFRVDELLSEAHVTLLRCVEIFDTDRGYRFSTYATNAIRHNLNRYISRQHRARQATREYIATDNIAAPECEHPRRREREYTDRMTRLLHWIHKLDSREQTIVRSRFGLTQATDKVTLQSLANQLGLSRERIRQLEIRAVEKLRAMARQTVLELEN
jgi:RNA polymerase sigma factor (sigma-70 family)